ncbi:hypothetical protein D9613_006578 [Agrocybe pediades]|uniref:Uncharacterized protein n=1 Tax=Agrocybe pediades TaxID=84607 RepID=A0A8H4VIA9_9AGAR|nr:hypothetical protein D9613_006578 [Agrocybe pediades]
MRLLLFAAFIAYATVAYSVPTTAPTDNSTVIHCRGPGNLRCPVGYTCCGPIEDGVGGM